jgi:hypothetical protein|eukprot:5909328-Prymnesium_polylepis.2
MRCTTVLAMSAQKAPPNDDLPIPPQSAAHLNRGCPSYIVPLKATASGKTGKRAKGGAVDLEMRDALMESVLAAMYMPPLKGPLSIAPVPERQSSITVPSDR